MSMRLPRWGPEVSPAASTALTIGESGNHPR